MYQKVSMKHYLYGKPAQPLPPTHCIFTQFCSLYKPLLWFKFMKECSFCKGWLFCDQRLFYPSCKSCGGTFKNTVEHDPFPEILLKWSMMGPRLCILFFFFFWKLPRWYWYTAGIESGFNSQNFLIIKLSIMTKFPGPRGPQWENYYFSRSSCCRVIRNFFGIWYLSLKFLWQKILSGTLL